MLLYSEGSEEPCIFDRSTLKRGLQTVPMIYTESGSSLTIWQDIRWQK